MYNIQYVMWDLKTPFGFLCKVITNQLFFKLIFFAEFRHKCEEDIDCEGELLCVLISNATKTTSLGRGAAVKLCQCPERADEFDDNCNGKYCIYVLVL